MCVCVCVCVCVSLNLNVDGGDGDGEGEEERRDHEERGNRPGETASIWGTLLGRQPGQQLGKIRGDP